MNESRKDIHFRTTGCIPNDDRVCYIVCRCSVILRTIVKSTSLSTSLPFEWKERAWMTFGIEYVRALEECFQTLNNDKKREKRGVPKIVHHLEMVRCHDVMYAVFVFPPDQLLNCLSIARQMDLECQPGLHPLLATLSKDELFLRLRDDGVENVFFIEGDYQELRELTD